MRQMLLSAALILGIAPNAFAAVSAQSTAAECRQMSAEQMIDKNYAANDGWRSWEYRRSAKADLNNDGETETVWLLANIARNPDAVEGEDPWLYEDGAPWAVAIENSKGKKTLVYLDWSQFGQAEMMIVNREENINVLIINRQDASIGIYEVKYQGPDNVKVCQILERDVYASAH